MPFLYNLQFHPKFSIAVGIAPSYLIADKITGQYQSIDKQYYSMKKFDFQPMGQVDFYLTDHISSSIRFSYSVSNIRNVNDESDVVADAKWYNNNLSLVLRYKIK